MDQIIFGNKTLGDVFKDIYTNTENKRTQINMFITKLVQLIQTPEDATMISPIIRDFMDVNVKNDEHIVRVAQIAQRALSISVKAGEISDILSEEEKQALLNNMQIELDDLQQEAKEVEDELLSMREK